MKSIRLKSRRGSCAPQHPFNACSRLPVPLRRLGLVCRGAPCFLGRFVPSRTAGRSYANRCIRLSQHKVSVSLANYWGSLVKGKLTSVLIDLPDDVLDLQGHTKESLITTSACGCRGCANVIHAVCQDCCDWTNL
eukprot:31543-Rhodomonas_salina.1